MDRFTDIRSSRWPDDRAAIAAIDTSFLVERHLTIVSGAHTVTLREDRTAPPWRKAYPLDLDEAETQSFCWSAVAEHEGIVTDFAATRFEAWNRRANLTHLYVAPSARGRGVGRALVDGAILDARTRGARCLWVETQTVNVPAIRFYEALGFVWCGFDASLYDPALSAQAETALFLARSLEQPA